MYNIFNDWSPNRGTIEFGKFRVLREQLKETLAKGIAYYRTNRTWIDSKHPLVSLLNSVTVPLSLEARVYNDTVEDQALELAQVLRYTSALAPGTVHAPSMLYGEGSADVVLVTIETYDVAALARTWREAAPIRILRHPRSDLGLTPLNGNFPTRESGIAVFAVNLPMLASQYRHWRREEGTLMDGELEAITTFLSRYPLANALTSHWDVAFFNRMVKLFQGEAPAAVEQKTPFWTLDLGSRVDDILLKELVLLGNRRITFDEILAQIPAISAECVGEVFRVPERGIYTRHVVWAYTLFRLPLLRFLLQQNARNANQRNTYYLKEIRRYFLAASNDREILQMLPQPYRQQVALEIRYGIIPYLNAPTALGMEGLSSDYLEQADSSFTHLGKTYPLNPFLIKARDLTSRPMKLSQLDWILQQGSPESEHRVRRADPHVPILATQAIVDGKKRWVVIDGFHRLCKAVEMGWKTIAVKVIPEAWFDEIGTVE